MKDAEIQRTLERFESVWPRVSGHGEAEAPPPPRDGAGTLPELIEREAEAERRYVCMASRTGGAAANTLRRLAAESRGLVRKLQTERYLRTGDSLSLPRKPPEKCRPLGESLRLAWSAAGAMEKAYAAEARTDDPALREVFRDAAKMKRGQRETLHGLARRLMR